MNWLRFVGIATLSFGVCEGLKCLRCKGGGKNCSDVSDAVLATCGDTAASCAHEIEKSKTPRNQRGCTKRNVSKDMCYWYNPKDSDKSYQYCYCKSDGCDASGSQTKPPAKPIKCLDDKGISKNCNSGKENSCTVEFIKPAENTPVEIDRRGCSYGVLATVEGCTHHVKYGGSITIKCYCQSPNCNAGGVEEWRDKFGFPCPFSPECEEKETTTEKQKETTETTTQKQKETTETTTTEKQKETTEMTTQKQKETTETTTKKQKETTETSTTEKQKETTTVEVEEETTMVEGPENATKSPMGNGNAGAAANVVGQALAATFVLIWR